ncbi:uracil-DNA glycosylase [Desulfocastanea catecholica]
MKSEKNELPARLRAVLGYHRSIGIGTYPRNGDVQSFLRYMVPAVAKAEPAQQKAAIRVQPVARKNSPAPTKSPVNLADIAAEVAACHACDLHKQRLYPVAGRGADKVRLLIVGDWLAGDAQGSLAPGHLFGVAQDEMLSRMLLAIKLSAGEVFLTNVIKCAVPGTCQPQAIHVQSCVSFLRRQIVALQPEVICTMGMVAARAVLERSQPLSRLRGQFHDYEVEKYRTIPVIATYHPTYLLQNPEMKQATWADLQLLAKKMGLV